jgi:beta-lactamase class A
MPTNVRKLLVLILISLWLVYGCTSQTDSYPLLRESLDPDFKAKLESSLRAEFKGTRRHLVDSGKVSIVIVDISDLHHPRVAEENGDQMLYAASLPKIAILLGAYVEVENGNLVIDDELRASMTRMIRNSSNADATAVLRRIGIARLAEILQSEQYRFYDPEYGGGLWVGREYGGALWQVDPINEIRHGASAMQVARFYYLLITNRLVSPQHTAEMLEILSKPAIKHKFVKGLAAVSPDAKIYRKSGTWRNYHADSGIIETKSSKYIVVVIGEHQEGPDDLVRLIQVVEASMKSGADVSQ